MLQKGSGDGKRLVTKDGVIFAGCENVGAVTGGELSKAH